MFIRVRVIAGSKKESIVVESSGRMCIAVREKAERNMANNQVVTLLADWYRCEKGTIRLISGHHHPVKLFSIKEKSGKPVF